jgi:signal transduction histidine kinase
MPPTLPESSARQQALWASGLLDTPPEPSFDRLTDLVRMVLDVPVSLVSLIDRDRQFFKSQHGLPEPWCSLRQTPLSHSFCQHVVDRAEPLVVSDAREHPLVKSNLAIEDLSVVAYLGVPLATPDEVVIGSLCAIAPEPRRWTDRDLATLEALAESVMTEIAVRYHLEERNAATAELEEASASLRQLNQDLESRVAERTEEVRGLANALTMAEQEERRRIGHVLHDDLQQVLHGVQMLLAAGDPDRASELVDQASRLTRTLAHELTPPVLREGTLGELVRWLADRQQEVYGLEVEVDVEDGIPRVDEAVRVLLYGVLREFLFNVVKHAGARQVLLTAEAAGEAGVRVVVADDGVGFDPTSQGRPSGIGLAGARDRIRLVGGRLDIMSAPGAGTRVAIEVPASSRLSGGSGAGR